MKTIKNIRVRRIVAVLTIASFSANAQEHFFEREVKMEKNTTLSVDNKFGTVKIGTLDSESNEIEVKFGGLEIDYIRNGFIEVCNGDTKIQKTGEINLVSKFGSVEMGKSNKVIMEVKNGSLRADKISDLEYEGAFGSYKNQRSKRQRIA